jgi:glycerol-3-phosphate dehydrogenase
MQRAVLSPESRAHDVGRLSSEEFDVLVVGGGITGAGVALDAITRGLSVALIEAQDWAAGTSSRSSKLIHGGLRYLQMMDFRLVHEALKERGLLLQRIAPHLVHPVPILYPLRRPVVERAYVGAGIALYDVLGWSTRSSRGLPLHRHLSRRHALRLAPGLDPGTLAGAVEYYDCQVDDARYVLEVVRGAVSYGAVAVSRMSLQGLRRAGDRVVGAVVRDVETGEVHEIRARSTILATGAWTEETEALAGRQRAVLVRPSKGIHIVVPRTAIDSEVALILRTEKSVLFVLPWGEHWVVGTTDTDWLYDKALPLATAADVDYLIEHVNRVLATPLRRQDVEAVYAGLRPLVAGIGVVRGPGETGARRIDKVASEEPQTTKVSREHAVGTPSPGLVVVSGGKYTTYRVMASDAVDAALADTGLAAGPAVTERVPLPGAEGYRVRWNQRASLAHRSGLTTEQIEHLLHRYGGMVDEVLDLVARDATLGRPLAGAHGYLAAEAVYAVTHEGARHLDDILVRRTRVAMECRDGGALCAADVAQLVAPLLGWDDATRVSEITAYRHAVELEQQVAAEAVDDADAMRLLAHEPAVHPAA